MGSNFLPMLKNTFKRNLVPFVVFQIITVFLTAFNLLYTVVFQSTYFMSAATAVGICRIEGLVMAILLFHELFSRRASDFLLALPVKRKEYFNSAFIFGIISIAVSFLICVVLSVAVMLTMLPESYAFDLSVFIQMMAASFFEVCEIFALFVLAACASGRIWHFFLLSALFIFAVNCTAAGFIGYINSIWGLWIDYKYEWILSPLAADYEFGIKQTVPICLASAVRFAVIYFAGLIVFKKRKAEVAETSVSGKFIPAAATVFLMLSVAFLCLCINNPVALKIIILLISLVLTAIAVSEIFYKKLFVKMTAVVLSAVTAFSLVFAVCVEVVPHKEYISYVPESSEVQSVSIDTGGYYGNSVDYIYLNGILANYGEYENIMTFESDEAKEKIYELHKKTVSEESQNTDGYGYSISFKYRLKNGKTVSRAYSAPGEVIYKEYISLLKTDEALNQLSPLNVNREELKFVCLNPFEKEIEELNLSDSELDELFECIKYDSKNLSDEVFNDIKGIGLPYSDDYTYYYETLGYVEFYNLDENISEEDKNLIQNMTYSEIELYAQRKRSSMLTMDDMCIITKEFKRTIEFFENRGYSFDYEEETE